MLHIILSFDHFAPVAASGDEANIQRGPLRPLPHPHNVTKKPCTTWEKKPKPIIIRAKMRNRSLYLGCGTKSYALISLYQAPLPPQSLLLVWNNISCGGGAGSIRPHACFLKPYQNLKLFGQMWLRTQFSPLLFFRWSWQENMYVNTRLSGDFCNFFAWIS